MMARIPLPTRESLPEDLQTRWDRLTARGPLLNIQRAFMTNPEIDLNARAVWHASGLGARQRELVILRAAYRKQSTYEWHQHVRIARDAGLSVDEINAVKEWRASPLFDEGDRVVLAYVDALADSPRPDDAAFEAVAASRSTGEVFGLTFLVTLYFQLAHVMAAFDLETEEPFIGWDVPARA